MAFSITSLISYLKDKAPSLLSIGTPGYQALGDTPGANGWSESNSAIAAVGDLLSLTDGQTIFGKSATAALDNPTTAPTLTAATGGSLTAGDYQVGYTYVNTYGETLISTSLGDITLDSSHGTINVAAITPLPAGVGSVNWYLSSAAGSFSLLYKTNNNGAALTLTSLPLSGANPTPDANTTNSSNHPVKGQFVAGSGMGISYDNATGNMTLSSTATSDAVTLQGVDVATTLPSNGQVLGYDSTASKWKPTTIAGSSNATSIQSVAVAATAPTNGQGLIYDSGTSSYKPTTITANSNATSIRGKNVSSTTPTSGQALVFDGSSYTPQAIVPTSGNATSVGGITVSGTPSSGQVLIYNGTDWIPSDIIAVDGNATTIAGFPVDTSTPGTGQAYVFNGSTFAPTDVATNHDATSIQGVNVSSTAPTTGQVLKYNGSAWAPDTDSTGGGSTFNRSYVYLSAPQTISSGGGGTDLVFDSQLNHTGTALWDGSTSLKNTTGASGFFLLTAVITFAPDVTGFRSIIVNGEPMAMVEPVSGGSNPTRISITKILSLSNNALVTITAQHTATGSIDVSDSGTYAEMYQIA